MTDRHNKHETKARETLRNAKRSGYRIYPAFNDEDDVSNIVSSIGNGNVRTLPVNFDNA